jgi:3-hydroxybutyryl-CoA dehydrogenase
MSRDPSLHGLPPAVRELQADLIVERIVVGVVGAGTMGAGIAQLAVENGHEVVLHDVDEAAIERGRARVREGLVRRALRLDLDGDSADEWVDGRLAALRGASSLDAVGAEAELVIEAALEDLELKRAIFRALDEAAGADVVLATNTSALSVAAIAEATRRPGRVMGLHFFNPAPVIPLVEVVIAPATDQELAERALALMTTWGKTAVRCADTPGFIVNRVNRPFTLEALRMLEAGVASVDAVDSAVRNGGFPMGPFELMDLIGIDVNLAAAQAVWERLGRPDRLRPSPIQADLVAGARLGRKTGAGFYSYIDDRRVAVAESRQNRASSQLTDAEILARILSAVDAEARQALAEGVATADDIDLALRAGARHPTGPFERALGTSRDA